MDRDLEQAFGLLCGVAEDIGFECTGTAPASELTVKPEVRGMCAVDTCGHYGKSWVCPPACGSIEYFRDTIAQHSSALLVQSVGRMEDDFDIDAMMDAARLQDERFARFVDDVLACLAHQGISADPLFLGSGSCTVCPTCNYPDPCRFPERQCASMEAAGLVVSEICTAAGIPYNHGPGTIAYTGCVII